MLCQCSHSIRESPGPCLQACLPADVYSVIVRHAGRDELRALHAATPAWRQAVCQGATDLAPASCDPAMLRRFPNLRALSLAGTTFDEPLLAGLPALRSLQLRDCTFHHPLSALAPLTALESCSLVDVRCDSSSELDAFLGGQLGLTRLELLRTARKAKMPKCSAVSKLRALRELVIYDDHSQAFALPQLTGLSDLRRLRLAKVCCDFNETKLPPAPPPLPSGDRAHSHPGRRRWASCRKWFGVWPACAASRAWSWPTAAS